MNKITPNWTIIFRPGNPHNSEILYKGQIVGNLRAIDLCVDPEYPIPHIKLDIFMRDVEVVTDLTDPT